MRETTLMALNPEEKTRSWEWVLELMTTKFPSPLRNRIRIRMLLV